MFAVHATDGWRRWISGVFSSRAAADRSLTLIPDGERSKQVVIDLGGMTYPLYICENDMVFRFLTEEEAVAELKRYAGDARRDDQDWCYTNLYRIVGDWQPQCPGTDYMGALPHHHVTNCTWSAWNGMDATHFGDESRKWLPNRCTWRHGEFHLRLRDRRSNPRRFVRRRRLRGANRCDANVQQDHCQKGAHVPILLTAGGPMYFV
jgi:hypothetical protein